MSNPDTRSENAFVTRLVHPQTRPLLCAFLPQPWVSVGEYVWYTSQSLTSHVFTGWLTVTFTGWPHENLDLGGMFQSQLYAVLSCHNLNSCGLRTGRSAWGAGRRGRGNRVAESGESTVVRVGQGSGGLRVYTTGKGPGIRLACYRHLRPLVLEIVPACSGNRTRVLVFLASAGACSIAPLKHRRPPTHAQVGVPAAGLVRRRSFSDGLPLEGNITVGGEGHGSGSLCAFCW